MNKLKYLLISWILACGFQAFGAIKNGSIQCQTPNRIKSFTIDLEKLFSKNSRNLSISSWNFGKFAVTEKQFDPSRSLSSLSHIRSQRLGSGFTKTVKFQGNQYKIMIKSLTQLNEIEDSITIKNHSGHQITYPLTCTRLK
ncbi:MAG: hypothetical protein HOE90_22285 [Bacteriovoracaceae bacterium]|jgi:hypothetical protein|nr:hypothetical protein [Bacteriovoracaceae bacterium]